MKDKLESVIADLERALEGTNEQDRAIVSNVEAPGLMRGAIQALKDIITDGARYSEVPGTSEQVTKLNGTITKLEDDAKVAVKLLDESRTLIHQAAYSEDGIDASDADAQIKEIDALIGPDPKLVEVDPNAAQAAGANQA